MPRLICTVRRCGLPLMLETGALRCDRGHTFDRARQGYWNLLQPQDRKSSDPGDRREAVEARARWLARDHFVSLARLLARVAGVSTLADGATVLDVGCGTGWFAGQLAAGRELDVVGIDLSARALRLAARALPEGTWIVANADRGLPLADGSVDLALSVFGRRPAAELDRVLRPGGRLVVAVPAEDDLAELREAAQGRASSVDRVPGVVEECSSTRLRLSERRAWRVRVTHDRAGLEDLLAMTYRGARAADRARLAGLDSLEVTLAADVLGFVAQET